MIAFTAVTVTALAKVITMPSRGIFYATFHRVKKETVDET
jgi:hypothetical protein